LAATDRYLWMKGVESLKAHGDEANDVKPQE